MQLHCFLLSGVCFLKILLLSLQSDLKEKTEDLQGFQAISTRLVVVVCYKKSDYPDDDCILSLVPAKRSSASLRHSPTSQEVSAFFVACPILDVCECFPFFPVDKLFDENHGQLKHMLALSKVIDVLELLSVLVFPFKTSDDVDWRMMFLFPLQSGLCEISLYIS